MSDVMTSQRAQEISERTRVGLQKVHSAAPVQTPQAVFPDDQVQLSKEAQDIVSGNSAEMGGDKQQDSFQQEVYQGASKAIDDMNSQLDRLMVVYGVNSEQTTRAGRKVTEALRNEVIRLAGNVHPPPALDVQVQQELNLVAREVEIKLEVSGQSDEDLNISVDVGKVDMEYDFQEEMNNLLVPEGTQGTDLDGNPLDIGRQQSGIFFLNEDQSSLGGGFAASTSAGSNPFDRFTTQSGAQREPASDVNPAAQAARPDINQDGNRDAADNSALVIVKQTPQQQQQLSYGASIFVADVSVPIPIRSGEATPSRGSRGGYE